MAGSQPQYDRVEGAHRGHACLRHVGARNVGVRHAGTRSGLRAALGLMLALAAGGAARAAVFGPDDRTAVPTHYQGVADKIGLFFNNATKSVCTAFCVADNVVATAAHCLFQPGAETSPHLAGFWFARGYDQTRDYARIAGFSTGAASQHIVTGATRLSTRPPIDAASDWALVRLARPACHRGLLPVTPMKSTDIVKASAEGRVHQIAYHRDWAQWRPAWSRACKVERAFGAIPWTTIARDFKSPEQLILHHCDTGGASSGSPLLIDGPGGPAVIGINVGTYEQSQVLLQAGQVTHRFKAETVANTGVGAEVILDKIAILQKARILTSNLDLRTVQEHLQTLGQYAGPLDGAYGPQLRKAIEVWEEAQRRTVTGLPTMELLAVLVSSRPGVLPSAHSAPPAKAAPTRPRAVSGVRQPSIR